jgi:hypothetical protein
VNRSGHHDTLRDAYWKHAGNTAGESGSQLSANQPDNLDTAHIMGTVVTDSEGNTFAARGSVRCATQLKFSLNDLTADERRTLESDLNLAARIQQAQLPTRDFASAGFEIRFHYEPAGLLSGDCCDLFESRDGLLFLLGDVSGKGIASSLLVGHLRAIFRSLADLPLDTMVKAAIGSSLKARSTVNSRLWWQDT